MLNYTSAQNLNLSKNLYPKPILRYKKNKKLGQLDYSFNISNIKLESMSNVQLGKSYLYPIKTLQHQNFKDLKIKTFLPFQQLSSSYPIAEELNSSLKILLNKNQKHTLKILAPIKGGFSVYSLGFMGFLPKSHYKMLIQNSVKFTGLNLPNSLYFSNLHTESNILTANTLVTTPKVSLQPRAIINNFSKPYARKTFSPVLSMVFLSQKNKKKKAHGKHKEDQAKS